MRSHYVSSLMFIVGLLLSPYCYSQNSIYVTDEVDYASPFFMGNTGQRIIEVNPVDGRRSVLSGPVMLNPKFVALDPRTGEYLATDLGFEETAHGDESVWRFDPYTRRSELVSGLGVGSGPAFQSPFGIAVNSSGTIFVVDNDLDAVFKIDPITGNRSILSDSDHGTGPDISDPIDITIMKDGSLAVTDSGDTIFKINATTGNRSYLARSTSPSVGTGQSFGSPYGITTSPDGQLIVADSGNDKLIRVDQATGNRSVISENSAQYSGDQFITLRDVIVDRDGTFVVSDSGEYMLIRVFQNGNRKAISGKPSDSGTVVYGSGSVFKNIRGLALDRDNNYVVADQGREGLVHVDRNLGDRSMVLGSNPGLGPNLWDPVGITIRNNEELIVADYPDRYFNSSSIFKINIKTGDRTIITGRDTGSGGGDSADSLETYTDVEVAPSGNLVAVANTAVMTIDYDTGNWHVLSRSGYPSRGTGDYFGSCDSLAADKNGRIYVTSHMVNSLVTIDPLTGNRDAYTNTGLSLSNQQFICLDHAGMLLFTDSGHEAIYKLDPRTGNGSIVSGQPPSPALGTGPQFVNPVGIKVEDDDHILVVDKGISAVIRVDPTTGDRTIVSGYDPVQKTMIGTGPWLYMPNDLEMGPPSPKSDVTMDQWTDLSGAAVCGACADGATQLYLQLTRLPAGIQASDIVITPPASSEGRLVGGIQLDSATHTAKQMYQVPAKFSWGTANTHMVNLSISIKGNKITRGLYLARPPVVMLHGLWSDNSTWEGMDAALKKAGFMFTVPFNYKSTHGLKFRENRDRARDAIQAAIRLAREDGYVASKIDVVAHSMGGVLTRYYLENLATTNYSQNIHKFITIGTPHVGSGMANLLISARSSSFWSEVARLLPGSITDGAVDDLAIGSDANVHYLNDPNRLRINSVPAYAIVGVADSPPASTSISSKTWDACAYRLMSFLLSQSTVTNAIGSPNDGVVGAGSQRGGCEKYQQMSVLFHTCETGNENVISKAIQLLNADVNGTNFDLTGFSNPPKAASAISAQLLSRGIPRSTALGTVQITDPANGATVLPGASLPITVTATGSVNSVYIGTNFTSVVDSSAPYTQTLSVPTDFVGAMTISAIGRDATGVVGTHSISVNVQPAEPMIALQTIPGEFLPLDLGQQYPLTAIGVYANDVQRDVTRLAGTTYSSANAAIASIDTNGIITAKKVGRTNILASNNSTNAVSRSITVQVFTPLPRNGVASWALFE